ncbi:SusC/RagA family TonB-linked outer membrane protein [Prolixibacteraceae bacterium JC049]|nr:SusC/RagA family TonB-linked outer membrane protein [Prolixibacteraceae bacterium JC049]
MASGTVAQNSRITLNFRNATIKEVLDEINKKTEVVFAYDAKMVDLSQRISIKANKKAVNDVLKEIFANKNIAYKIKDNIVVLSKTKPQTEKGKEGKKITGKVTDSNGEPLPGVTITVLGTTQGVVTDIDGKYSIGNIKQTDKLVFSFIGFQSLIMDIGNKTRYNITLEEKTEELEDVTVVAFGKQKKKTVVGSVTSIRPAELKIPSSNITGALAGRMSGVIAYQRSGEPGKDNSEFFIRGVTTFGYKKDPLILIDGIELTTEDFARLQPDDIASFSILKDATATAIYGARGANGVVLVTTKEGKQGKMSISGRFEHSISSATKDISIADPITYMKMFNEAVKTRNNIGELPYSESKIENTIKGTNPYVYPAVNWYDELIKKSTNNQRFNINMNGGGNIVRYYLAVSGSQDNGMLKVDDVNNFSNNIDLKKLSVRSNVNIKLTRSTDAVLRFHGTFDDYNGPIDGGTAIFNKVMQANPVLFPKYYPANNGSLTRNHILFGNYGEGNYLNPYADLVKGYKEYSRTLVLAQTEIKQKLDFITRGLSFSTMVNTTRSSYFDVTRSTVPYFYNVGLYNKRDDTYSLEPLNEESGKEYLNYSEGKPSLYTTFYLQSVLNYKRTFNEKHSFGGLLVYILRSSLRNNTGNLQKSLPYRNVGVSGRVTYDYDRRYLAEFNFGYNGSERFSKQKRFGFFPSIGLGWTMSEEKFFEPFKSVVSKFKLKGSYGLVGNDAIGSADDRFFYLSQVNMDNGGRGARFGEYLDFYKNGVSIDRYENADISWETATKANMGFELSMLDNKIEIQADYFYENRENILMDRSFIPPAMGVEAKVRANVGEAQSSGFDASIDYNQTFSSGWWVQGRANFTYAVGKFKVYEEPDFSATSPWRAHKGQPLDQQWGYIAERLFVDENEVLNSPKQFGNYGAGDIKYKDINKDGKIDFMDEVPIGHPTRPEIVYGFGLSTGYKGFDFSCFFQGNGRVSFWIDPKKTAPFVDNNKDANANNALLQVYADSHWSEANQDIYALWPRLSTSVNENNSKRSTWFMRNGSFLRLKQVELGYTLPKSLQQKIGLNNLRVYVTGVNLLTFSKFKLWDPEMAGNGLGYPIQKVFNLGIQISL